MSQDTLPVAQKLLEATYKQADINAANMANWMVPGAQKLELSTDFETQFRQMVDAGNYAGVGDLEVTTEATEKGIDYQTVMQAVKDTQLNNQFLTQVVSDNLKQIEMAISTHS